jgi:hypothetical protein
MVYSVRKMFKMSFYMHEKKINKNRTTLHSAHLVERLSRFVFHQTNIQTLPYPQESEIVRPYFADEPATMRNSIKKIHLAMTTSVRLVCTSNCSIFHVVLATRDSSMSCREFKSPCSNCEHKSYQ